MEKKLKLLQILEVIQVWRSHLMIIESYFLQIHDTKMPSSLKMIQNYFYEKLSGHDMLLILNTSAKLRKYGLSMILFEILM